MSEATTEKRIVASCLKDRKSFITIKKHVDPSKFSPYGEWVFQQAEAYYEKDGDISSVDQQQLLDLAKLKFDNPSKANTYSDYISACFNAEISPANLTALIVEQLKKHKGSELAQALANDYGSKNTSNLLEEYQELSAETLEEEKEERYQGLSVQDVNKVVLDAGGRIKLGPKSLNERLKFGGVLPGHHIVVFARPESGKTALVLSMLRSFALQGLKAVYFGNEDPILDIISRFQACLTGWEDEQRLKDPQGATELLLKSGYNNIVFQPITPGTPFEIRQHVKEIKPKCIILDQIRNLTVKADTRVNQLEAAATFARNLGKQEEMVVVSVTQAGDSAQDKLVLGMGDIDFSNTGIPATADLMLGIGVNDEFRRNGQVMFSLPKNKIGGKHDHWPVRLNEKLSRMESIE